MNKLKTLKRIETLYTTKDQNIIRYLKDISGQEQNTLEDIMISYDFQAGTYTEQYEKNPGHYDHFVSKLARTINDLDCRKSSIFECGIGEATIFVTLMNKLDISPVFFGGGRHIVVAD